MKSLKGRNPLPESELLDTDGRPWSPASPYPIWVPEPPTVEGDHLTWRGRGEPEFTPFICLWPRFPDEQLLMDFTRLAAGSDAAVCEFATRWGPLDPAAFGEVLDFVTSPEYWPRHGGHLTCVVKEWPQGKWREALTRWRLRARQASSVVRIAS